MPSRPDILVLGGGGILGEAWMAGVLAGIEDAHDIRFSDCDYFVGTSAGAIVAAGITAGSALRRPAEAETAAPDTHASPRARQGVLDAAMIAGADLAITLTGPWIRFGLATLAPVGAHLRSAGLRFVPSGTRTHASLRQSLAKLDARFDGRLRVTAVSRSTGERVVFGSPGGPDASVATAVAASCAVPARFAPVVIAGVEYVDGGVWSPTNLDAAPAHRGAYVLCLSPTGSVYGPLSRLLRVPSRGRTLLEIAALRGAGVHVELLTPDAASAAAIGADPMADRRRAGVLAAGYAQGLRG